MRPGRLLKESGWFIILLLIVAFMITGCINPANTIPGSGPQTAASQDEVIELKYVDFGPYNPSGLTGVSQRWADKINELSNGRVKITCYWDGSLVSQVDQYRAVLSGIADICFYSIGINPGLHELNRVFRLPMLGWPSPEAATEIWEKVWEEFPELSAEFKGLKVLGARFQPPYRINTVNKIVRVPSDLKGMYISCRAEWAEVLEGAGAFPMETSPANYYITLDKGLVDGQIVSIPISYVLDLLDLFKYETMFGDSGVQMVPDFYLINENVWNSFPPDIQAVFETASEWRQQEAIRVDSEEQIRGITYARSRGNIFIEPDADETSLWLDAVRPFHAGWIAENASRGPSQAIYDEIQRLIAGYSAKPTQGKG